MCGRYLITTPAEALDALFGTAGRLNLRPRYNLAPTEDAPVVRLDETGGREVRMLRWGLVPAWAKDPSVGARMINARGESVAEKPAFRSAFRLRRCLIPADGFYEWKSGPQGKQPYLVRLMGGAAFAFAGLWERWVRDEPGGAALETFTIVTTEAPAKLRGIHPRMPVILAPENHETWLKGAPEAAAALIGPYPEETLEAVPVSTRVNSVRNDDPECTRPLSGKGGEPQVDAKTQMRLI